MGRGEGDGEKGRVRERATATAANATAIPAVPVTGPTPTLAAEPSVRATARGGASETDAAPSGKASDAPVAARGDAATPPELQVECDAEAMAENEPGRASVVPSIPPPPAGGPWRSYKEIIANLSARLVEAQRPIRVLNAIQWAPGVFEAFKKSKFRDVPPIGPEHYEGVDLGFEPRAKQAELEELVRDIERDLGDDAIGGILRQSTAQYRDVVRMLEARGTPAFHAYSRKLYGSPKDRFPDGKTTVRESAHTLYELLSSLRGELLPQAARDIPATRAVEILNARLTGYFGESTVRVIEDDGIFADAAAGSDYVKIRRGALFSLRDIDILEVHEGWVHLATSLNGEGQPVARWLGKGPPRTTAAQEGLAALMEIITFRTYPRRARRLNDRVLAVDKAEDGADFAQVFDWYRTEGYDEEECFNATRRIFRGGTTTGGAPFTKDICYSKGIVLNYAFLRACIEQDRAELIPYLFAGKVAHEDVPILFSRANDGVVRPPTYLPPSFRDLSGLAVWMSYSTFFTRLAGNEVKEHYARMFAST